MILLLGNQRSLLTGYKQWRNFINDTPGSLDHWKMLSEDLELKGGILSRRRQVRRYLGIRKEDYWWCRRNGVTERRRRWKTRRERRDGGGII